MPSQFFGEIQMWLSIVIEKIVYKNEGKKYWQTIIYVFMASNCDNEFQLATSSP